MGQLDAVLGVEGRQWFVERTVDSAIGRLLRQDVSPATAAHVLGRLLADAFADGLDEVRWRAAPGGSWMHGGVPTPSQRCWIHEDGPTLREVLDGLDPGFVDEVVSALPEQVTALLAQAFEGDAGSDDKTFKAYLGSPTGVRCPAIASVERAIRQTDHVYCPEKCRYVRCSSCPSCPG